ncbi:hypothetical protein HYV73_01780 [Candidatus Uhrbacteria bacterium]|nr:hypothetical protein [Candidatus Uhrbacteria bacterium]
MKHHLERLLGVVRRTGEKVILTDVHSDEVYVLMSLTEYEALMVTPSFIDGDDQASDEISDDEFDLPAMEADDWRSNIFPREEEDETLPRIWDHMAPATSKEPTWDLSGMKEEERAQVKQTWEQQMPSPVPSREAQRETPQSMEEITIEPVPVFVKDPQMSSVEEGGEDRFFLEPID